MDKRWKRDIIDTKVVHAMFERSDYYVMQMKIQMNEKPSMSSKSEGMNCAVVKVVNVSL